MRASYTPGMTLAELMEAVRNLAPAEQYELANHAMAAAETSDAATNSDDAWKSEFRRRIDDIERGHVQMIEHTETIRVARERVATRRANRMT